MAGIEVRLLPPLCPVPMTVVLGVVDRDVVRNRNWRGAIYRRVSGSWMGMWVMDI